MTGQLLTNRILTFKHDKLVIIKSLLIYVLLMINETILLVGLLFLAIIFNLIIIGLFIFQMYKMDRYTPQIIIAMGFSLFTILWSIIDIFFQNYTNYNPIFYLLKSIFITITYYFLYLHYEGLQNNKPSLYRHSIIFSMAILTISIYIMKIGGIIPLFITQQFIPIDAIETVLGVIVFIFCINVMKKTITKVRSRNTFLELFALLFLFLANLVWLTAELLWSIYTIDIARLFTILTIIGSALIFIGILLILVEYLFNIEYLYQIPISIHSVSIISSGGLLVYHRKTETKEIQKLQYDEYLFSGAIQGVYALMNDVFGEGIDFDNISLGKYNVFFKRIDENYILLLLASSSNYFLSKSIERFRKHFIKFTFPDLEKPVESSVYTNMIDPMVKRIFPYLQIAK